MERKKNDCARGYSMLKCAGDEHHGVCSIWHRDGDSGQYFVVNADAPLPPLATVVNSSSSAIPLLSTETTSTPSAVAASTTPAVSASATPDVAPARGGAIPQWTIALICVLGAVALSVLSLLFPLSAISRLPAPAMSQTTITRESSPGGRQYKLKICEPTTSTVSSTTFSGAQRKKTTTTTKSQRTLHRVWPDQKLIWARKRTVIEEEVEDLEG
ncbi:hypothetical protein AURDEDRAFT_172396 [Auricularia subglabra TFB-10046 SS5]|nr:hypothetical protein AURDEDRAFT_172396 [Auricularia subglabra TFB-10046 SS5]